MKFSSVFYLDYIKKILRLLCAQGDSGKLFQIIGG